MNKTLNFSRFLRSNMTEAETLLWSKIRHDQLGFRFRRQHKVGGYIIDFYCADLKLAIEVDGGQHNESIKDVYRTKALNERGIRVLRFWNSDVLNNIDGVVTQISLSLNPSPSLHEEEGNLWKKDFPALNKTVHGKPLVFLDSGASAQKPQCVIDALTRAYTENYANVHRGLYDFSQRMTAEFENAREKIAKFIGAPSPSQIIFTRNATEGINLVAQSWARKYLKAGDEIILTEMEHHANLVPWHILRDQIGIVIKYIPVTDRGELDYESILSLLSTRTKLVACTQVSNVLGTVNNINKIKTILSVFNPEIKLLVDGSQAVVHQSVNMVELDADFYVFTGHKLYGPTGIGVLYGKSEILAAMPPYQGGGDMIETVTLDGSTYADAPSRFEAGTPAIAEAIALGAAIDYINSIGMDKISAWEKVVSAYATEKLSEIEGLKIIGTADGKAGIISFVMDGCPPADVAMILDQMGVAVRTGHHCCQPLMARFGVEGTVRASLALYNDKNDIDILVKGLLKAQRMLK
jgi:cysteine desulfurase/selenocysteine lyase